MPRPGLRPVEALDSALRRGHLATAMDAAHQVQSIPLYKALWLTVLMADNGSPEYKAACRRILVRFIVEQKPRLEAVRKLALALEEIGDLTPEAPAARRALLDLAERLRGDMRGPRPRAE